MGRWVCTTPQLFIFFDAIIGIADFCQYKKVVAQVIAEYLASVLSMLPQAFMVVDENPFMQVYNLEYYGKDYNNQDNRLQNPPRPHEFFYGAFTGVSYGMLVEVFGPVSGAFIMPSVTLGMFVAGEIKLLKALLYIYIQVIGAKHGVSVVYTLCASTVDFQRIQWYYTIFDIRTTTKEFMKYLWMPYARKLMPRNILHFEALASLFFITVAISAHDLRRRGVGSPGGIGVGAMLAACTLAIRRITGSVLNAAKSYAICYFYEDMDIYNTAYIYANMVAGLVAGVMFRLLLCFDDESENLASVELDKFKNIVLKRWWDKKKLRESRARRKRVPWPGDDEDLNLVDVEDTEYLNEDEKAKQEEARLKELEKGAEYKDVDDYDEEADEKKKVQPMKSNVESKVASRSASKQHSVESGAPSKMKSVESKMNSAESAAESMYASGATSSHSKGDEDSSRDKLHK